MIYSTFGDVRGLLLGTSDNIATHLYVLIPSPTSFLQVLLLSRALEITVQRCLEAPFPDKYDLASLAGVIFAAQPSFAKHDTLDALFSAIVQLGKLMPTSNSKHSIEMRRRARIAVAGTLHVLKEQDPMDSPSSVQSFDSELPDRAATQAQQLEGLGRQISDPLESKSRCLLATDNQHVHCFPLELQRCVSTNMWRQRHHVCMPSMQLDLGNSEHNHSSQHAA